MSVQAIDLGELHRRLRGAVIPPGSEGFDEARRTFNAMIERRPAVIVRPLHTADVAEAVRWASETDLPISVRGGGHSVAGHSVGEGSLMLDLGEMRAVSVDPIARMADVEGGALLEDLDRATTAHGLAAPSGTYSETGVGGLTLTGGLSYILGAAGFACDALVGAELVAADGLIHEVDAETDAELLWALRGGGGNFGVVTRFRFALTPIGGVYGGRITYGPNAVPSVLHQVFEHRATAPDELTLQAVLFRNAELNAPAITVIGAWTGDPAAAEAAFAPFRQRPEILDDGVGPMSYLDLQSMGARMGSAYRHYWKGQFVGESSNGLEDAILAAAATGRSEGGILIETIHGMAHRIPDEHAAFGARGAVANVSALAIWADEADDAAHVAWARATAEGLVPYALRGGAGYLNYAPVDESASRVERAFGPERFARLQAVKRRCDPDNRFRFNANIPPA
jgi:FAD/FMN-containing dehydrogenase